MARFVLSKKKVLAQYARAKQHGDLVAYSSKTNPAVTPILEDNTNCMFSIHSIHELARVKNKKRVLYFAQAWDKKIIKELTTQGIRWFVVDNEEDLKTFQTFLNHSRDKLNLLLRVKLRERTLKTERYFVFGMPVAMIRNYIEKLHAHPNIDKLGIHFHRKTQNMAEWRLVQELNNMFDEHVFKKISLVNIGGGLPAQYANTNKDVIRVILQKIDEVKTFLNQKKIELMLEPGRFISAPSCKLVTNILQVQDNVVVVDASIYQGDTDAFVVPVKLLVEGERTTGKPYIIKGVTPCSMDLFRYRCYLDNPRVGDELVFLNAGAYNFGTNFCDLPELTTEIVD